MKSMLNTQITFGLVSIPVKVHRATESHNVESHQYHGGDCRGPVGYTRTCKTCAEPVEWADIAKGFEGDDGQVVIVTADELAAVERETISGIEVLQFVQADEISPMILDTPHYLAPDPGKRKGGGNLQGYALLRQVLDESHRVAVCRYVIREAAHMAVLRVEGNVLVLQNMCWADELRAPAWPDLDKRIELDPKMVKAAHALVESMMGTFHHGEYTDSYTEHVRELIHTKAAGVAPVSAEQDEVGTADVSDLLAALESSVKARQEKEVARRRHPAGHKRDVA